MIRIHSACAIHVGKPPFLACVAAFVAVGCATPTPYNSRQVSGDSQFFVHPASYSGDITALAIQYCTTRGKTAYLGSQVPHSPGGIVQSNYICR